jgi:hypothetical protein
MPERRDNATDSNLAIRSTLLSLVTPDRIDLLGHAYQRNYLKVLRQL